VPQARVGIYLAVKYLVKPGQKVVLSPYTIADVINMVICAGAVPVFADIDRASTNISADEVERLVDSQTGAVMVTHLHGIPCEIERISAFCKARGIPLIEDTAQAFGSKVNGRRLGTFGDAGIFSFGMYKNVTGFYGGMLVTSRKDLADKARAELAQYPYMPFATLFAKVRKALFTDIATWPPIFRAAVYWIFRFAYLHNVGFINKMVTVELDTSRKEKLSDSYLNRFRPFQARMVLGQLDQLDEFSEVRIRYSRIYHEGLKDLSGLIIPPFKDDGSHIYNYFPIQFADRGKLVRFLMLHRRDLAIQHLKNCAALPGFSQEKGNCPKADQTANQTVLLPNYPSYGEDQVRRNVEVVRLFFSSGADKA
jgi:dTDP-4-amino-4,6-dideoxygalactose transaminase